MEEYFDSQRWTSIKLHQLGQLVTDSKYVESTKALQRKRKSVIIKQKLALDGSSVITIRGHQSNFNHHVQTSDLKLKAEQKKGFV